MGYSLSLPKLFKRLFIVAAALFFLSPLIICGTFDLWFYKVSLEQGHSIMEFVKFVTYVDVVAFLLFITHGM